MATKKIEVKLDMIQEALMQVEILLELTKRLKKERYYGHQVYGNAQKYDIAMRELENKTEYLVALCSSAERDFNNV